jgi:peptidoglycan/LPS O-acetylase OafA/YrhL
MSSSLRPSLKALTGVRFLAALHVMAFHYAPRESAPAWLHRFLECGPSSVTLFFILSGFILAYSYLGAQETVRVEPRAFWAARFARVYPVYVLGLVLMTPPLVDFLARAAGGLTQEVLWKLSSTGAAVFTLTQAWAPPMACVWNCPGWSLSVEAFFYLLFPLLCMPVVRARQRGLWAAAAAMVGVAVIASVLWLLVEQWIAGSSAPLLGPDTWRQVAAYNPLLRLPQFLLGVVLGRLFAQRVSDGRGIGPAAPVQAVVAAMACLAIFVAPWSGSALAFKELALMPPFALLIWGLAVPPSRRPRFCRVLHLSLGEPKSKRGVRSLLGSSTVAAKAVGGPVGALLALTLIVRESSRTMPASHQMPSLKAGRGDHPSEHRRRSCPSPTARKPAPPGRPTRETRRGRTSLLAVRSSAGWSSRASRTSPS